MEEVKNQSRPFFHISSISEHVHMPREFNKRLIKAGGVLLYRKNKNTEETEVLLIHKVLANEWEDIGGRTDVIDSSIWDTIEREVREETNGLIHVSKERLYNSRVVYNDNAKYLLCILPATEEETGLTTLDFGSVETHDGIYRHIYWIPLRIYLTTQFLTMCANFRLKHYMVHRILNALFESEVKNESPKER